MRSKQLKTQIQAKYLKVGAPYHLKWANRGCVWILVAVNGDQAELKTPKTKKTRFSKLSELTHTNHQSMNICMGFDPYQRSKPMPDEYIDHYSPFFCKPAS